MSIRKLPLQVALQGGRKMPRCHYRFCLCNTFCQNLIKNFKTCTFSWSDVSKIRFHTKTKWLCIFVTEGAFSAAPYLNLYKYFNPYACPSIRRRSRLSCCPLTLPISAVVLRNVTNKSCQVCVKSKKYAFLVTPLGSKRQGLAVLY